jgi:hypothetical protein
MSNSQLTPAEMSTMNDLRKRVAAVLLDYWPAPVFGSDRQMQQVADLADAVIAELGDWKADNETD